MGYTWIFGLAGRKNMFGFRLGKTKCHTYEAAMDVIIVSSRIEHEIIDYFASEMTRLNAVIDDETRKKAVARAKRMNPGEQYAKISNLLENPDTARSLRKIRKVRNKLAHCVEYVTEGGVVGNYDEPVKYSLRELKDVISDAGDCREKMQGAFLKSAQYAAWKR